MPAGGSRTRLSSHEFAFVAVPSRCPGQPDVQSTPNRRLFPSSPERLDVVHGQGSVSNDSICQIACHCLIHPLPRPGARKLHPSTPGSKSG